MLTLRDIERELASKRRREEQELLSRAAKVRQISAKLQKIKQEREVRNRLLQLGDERLKEAKEKNKAATYKRMKKEYRKNVELP